jgi:nicotinamidase/pyrazinamidase
MSEVLVIIDPQNDFIISDEYKGSLGVDGALQDIEKIINYIKLNNPENILVTLDTHNEFDIAHHSWWINEKKQNPNPFTIISYEDVISGVWKAKDPSLQSHAEKYTLQLKEQNKHMLCIWPNHCIENTFGQEINPQLKETLNNWEIKNNTKVEYLIKGMNPNTEHYSAFKAEVVIPEEKDTYLRTDIISYLSLFDKISICGEASSHCVAESTMDLLNNLSLEQRKKVTILKNCMSPVKGFEKSEEKFFEKAIELNANIEEFHNVKKLKM